ncbi:MAG TPA: acylphosphatase [Bryobacteraceae bacterium]|nr:acylphosphatase [Bryobacteraceae bacterium]
MKPVVARRWFIRGRVQGVGFRYFVQHAATGLNLRGYTRNLDDGRVEVYAVGPTEKLSELAAMLHQGSRFSEVRGVEEQEAPVRTYSAFEING